MAIFRQLRTRVHHYLLQRKLDELQPGDIVNLHEAKTIGVLCDATDPQEFGLVSKYMQQLREHGKQVHLLAYIKDPKLAEHVTVDHFTNKQVSFLFNPNGADVQSFIKHRFDVMLYLNVRRNLPLEYIAALSKARYKVGRYIEDKTYCFDLMVYLDEAKDLDNMIKEVHHLITEINKHKNATAV